MVFISNRTVAAVPYGSMDFKDTLYSTMNKKCHLAYACKQPSCWLLTEHITCIPIICRPSADKACKISLECAKIGQAWPYIRAICFVVPCTTYLNNLILIPEILNEIDNIISQTKPIMENSNFCGMHKNSLSMTISNNDLLHGTSHY